jgi:hypothetical protein
MIPGLSVASCDEGLVGQARCEFDVRIVGCPGSQNLEYKFCSRGTLVIESGLSVIRVCVGCGSLYMWEQARILVPTMLFQFILLVQSVILVSGRDKSLSSSAPAACCCLADASFQSHHAFVSFAFTMRLYGLKGIPLFKH